MFFYEKIENFKNKSSSIVWSNINLCEIMINVSNQNNHQDI